MKSKPKNLSTMYGLFLTLFIFLSTNSLAQELRREGRYYAAEITKNFTVKKGGTLHIFDVRGDIDVNTWEKNQVQIHELVKMDVFTEEEAATALKRFKSSYRQTGDVIEIGGEGYYRDRIKSNLKVTVPHVFNVELQTRGGDLTVSRLAGEVSLRTSGGDIALNEIDGIVDAKTSGGDIEVISARKKVTIKTSGGDLELEDIGGPLTATTSGGDITLRRSDAKVDIRTSGGDIELSDVGGEVKAHTSGGDVDIMNTKGSVDVHTSGGDIELRNIGGSLEASTSGGDIEGRSIQGGARISTAGGSIDLRDVKGGVRGKTAGGDISVEITLMDFKKDHRVDLRTAGGEITLYIPEKLPATILAEIEISDRWEDYNIYSDFPLTSSEDSKREKRRGRWGRRIIRSEGKINGGGDLIELYTTNGDIHIKKLRK
ncbi:MAG: DUF4097 domain-containing protein [bacterium]